jgi:DNA-binding GntR family transcriptional regulator
MDPHPYFLLRQLLARTRETILGIVGRGRPHSIQGTKELVTAASASDEVARYIDCAESEPAMRFERVHVYNERRPAERCVNYSKP